MPAYSSGEATLDEGEDKTVIKFNLPQVPLSNVEETINVFLEEPSGAPSRLDADNKSCLLTIKHDQGKYGKVELTLVATRGVCRSINVVGFTRMAETAQR